jgi:malonyl CoA-acyl carrier protein transacylase
MESLVAILCSGQGRQHPAMFDLVASCPEAEPVFAAAAKALGQDPRRFVREAASADLFADLAGQILCCTQALATRAALGPAWPARAVIAGYSIGELAAWGCAGAIDGPTTLGLAQRRAAADDGRRTRRCCGRRPISSASSYVRRLHAYRLANTGYLADSTAIPSMTSKQGSTSSPVRSRPPSTGQPVSKAADRPAPSRP